MRKLPVTLMALAPFLVATPAMAENADSATAELVDPNHDPNHVPSGITADVTFHDNGSRLRVTGIAQGMDPMKKYISLIYDPGSKATGANACLPSNPSPLNFDKMQLGDWQPIGSSTRTLDAERLGVAYITLSQFGTVSIRGFVQPVTGGPNAALPLQACGKVVPQR
ncbi:MAG: hypothetical protein M3178_09310 [Pseudomonadota bacterium]|nr:hypothetical protein [Pseudomonadota bacterium]